METKGQEKELHENGNKDIAQTTGEDSRGVSLNNQPEEHIKSQIDQSTHAEEFLLVHRKVERLSTAVYLVTSFLSDSEPLKWRMRELGLVVLEGISQVREGVRFEREHSIARSIRAIHDILTLAEIAVAAGMMSEMNFRILKTEYRAVRDEIREKNSAHTPTQFELPKDFFSGFETSAHLHPLYAKGDHKGQESIGQKTSVLYNHQRIDSVRKNEDTRSSSSMPTDLSQGGNRLSNHTAKRSVPFLQKKPHATPSNTTQTNSAKGIRRATVLELFYTNAALTVKDVAKKLPGFSEKTAQRELAVLVAEGVLKRTGERRWSSYSRVAS